MKRKLNTFTQPYTSVLSNHLKQSSRAELQTALQQDWKTSGHHWETLERVDIHESVLIAIQRISHKAWLAPCTRHLATRTSTLPECGTRNPLTRDISIKNGKHQNARLDRSMQHRKQPRQPAHTFVTGRSDRHQQMRHKLQADLARRSLDILVPLLAPQRHTRRITYVLKHETGPTQPIVVRSAPVSPPRGTGYPSQTHERADSTASPSRCSRDFRHYFPCLARS
jgi:hypothetical protein